MTINLNNFILIIAIIYFLNNASKVYCAKAKQPNIIVIMADDLGWNDVSYHGSNQIPTPNIDSLAYNGVILKNHYVLPICTPSRTAFFTGRYPIREGMQGFPLRAGEARGIPLSTKLLPEHLKRLGYSTRLIGKWHLGYYQANFTPARRGFDSFFGYYNGYITYFNHTITESNRTGYDLHRDKPSKLSAVLCESNKYATELFTDEAVEVIERHNKSRPLYLQLSHLAPHASDALETLETQDMAQVNKTFGYIRDIKRRKFAGMMSSLDDSVGRVTEALRKNGLLQNSIIIFMADNGAQTVGLHENHGSNYPFRGLKFTLFEGGVHGVACVYSPGIINQGRIVRDLMHMTDWLPTLYRKAGGKISDLGIIDGVNQWSVIKNGTRGAKNRGRKSVLINIDEKQQLEAAIQGKWKLLKGASKTYDGYFRENISDVGWTDDQYVNKVLMSPANQAINKMTDRPINRTHILKLRNETRVVCSPLKKIANCSRFCLFNLETDPCETTDLSNQNFLMVVELENFINRYRGVLMNQTNVPVDPAALPENFHGVWMPWHKSNVPQTSTRYIFDEKSIVIT